MFHNYLLCEFNLNFLRVASIFLSYQYNFFENALLHLASKESPHYKGIWRSDLIISFNSVQASHRIWNPMRNFMSEQQMERFIKTVIIQTINSTFDQRFQRFMDERATGIINRKVNSAYIMITDLALVPMRQSIEELAGRVANLQRAQGQRRFQTAQLPRINSVPMIQSLLQPNLGLINEEREQSDDEDQLIRRSGRGERNLMMNSQRSRSQANENRSTSIVRSASSSSIETIMTKLRKTVNQSRKLIESRRLRMRQ